MTALVTSIKGFAHEHDQVPAFHAAFLVATILSAAVFNLGFFACAIAAHMSLDFVKYRDFHHMSLSKTCRAIARESIGDIALFLTALTFAVYLNHTFMLSAMSGMLRSELTLLRAVGTIIPKIRIMENILAIALNIHTYMHTPNPMLNRKLSRIEKCSVVTIVVCSALLIGAVFLYMSHQWDLSQVLKHELIPGI